MSRKDQTAQVLEAAKTLFGRDVDWVVFFREVLGLGGLVRRHFPTVQALAEFEQTETYSQIQQMLARLRERQRDQPALQEETRVITVRLPKSLHEALWEEAHELRTSVNKLCISKLLQFIDRELVPPTTYRHSAAGARRESKEEVEEAEAGL